MKKTLNYFGTFFFIMFFVVGCVSLGGTNSAVKPETVAKLETAMKTAQKQIDESQQKIEGVQGDVQTFKTTITEVQNTQNILQMQLTNITTTNNQHNESIKSLMWAVAGIWIVIKSLGFIQFIISAKLLPGSTIKNFFTLPWNKGKE